MAIESLQRDGFLTTRLDEVIKWARKNSLWPMPMGISCCAIEMMATVGALGNVHPRHLMDLNLFDSRAAEAHPQTEMGPHKTTQAQEK